MFKKWIRAFALLLLMAFSIGATGFFLNTLLLGKGIQKSRPKSEPVNLAVMDRFGMYMTNRISAALDGVLDIEKVYWLTDDVQVAPEPNQELFGYSFDPSTLGWLLEDAKKILKGQNTLFSTETKLAPNTKAEYYLDDTIFAVTWKQPFNDTMYTISEIKIAHPSQFRRFLAGGSYGSGIQMITSDMAANVNAVVASSGDFYAFRRMGVIVYDGVVQRTNPAIDTCYIDTQGNLIFSRRGELATVEEAQAFVDANDIRFSVAFGPLMIENGVKQDYTGYVLGEVVYYYARAALCQMDDLHYLLITAGKEGNYQNAVTVAQFQDQIASFGVRHAYALDGGQTAVIVMNDKVINSVLFGYQRNISDIIYFATAIPSGE